MQRAWHADPERRPDSETVYTELQSMQEEVEEASSSNGSWLNRRRTTPNDSAMTEPVSVALQSMGELANGQQEAGDDQIIVVENCVQDHTANRQELARAMIEAREALAASKQVVAAEVNMAEAKEDKQMFTPGQPGKGRFATELRVEREKKGNRTAPDATRTL